MPFLWVYRRPHWVRCSASSMQQHEWSLTCDRATMSLQRCASYTGFRSLKGSTLNYVCLFTRHLLGRHHSSDDESGYFELLVTNDYTDIGYSLLITDYWLLWLLVAHCALTIACRRRHCGWECMSLTLMRGVGLHWVGVKHVTYNTHWL